MEHALYSSLACFGLHAFFQRGLRRSFWHANLLTCILFQVAFVSEAALILKAEVWGGEDAGVLRPQTLANLYNAVGYFVYDTAVLLKSEPGSMFLAHHVAALLMLWSVISAGVTETWYHNAICLAGEVTNPFLNVRHLLKGWPRLYRANIVMMWLMWLTFRIMGFAYLSFGFLGYIRPLVDPVVFMGLRTLFWGVYGASWWWWYKITRLLGNLKLSN